MPIGNEYRGVQVSMIKIEWKQTFICRASAESKESFMNVDYILPTNVFDTSNSICICFTKTFHRQTNDEDSRKERNKDEYLIVQCV